MKAFLWLATATLLPVTASTSDPGQFFVPPKPGANQDYTNNYIYVVGETQKIKFTTTFQDYTINLWQQSLTQSAASRGPSIFSVQDGAVTEFDWLVQLYQFELSNSNVFFLWLISDSDPASVSSHYFNITDRTPTSSTSTLSLSTVFTPPLTPTGLSTTSPVPPPTPTPTAPTPAPPPPSVLSTGAQAGIGVGAALAGLAAIIIAIVLYRRSRQQRTHQPHAYVESQGAGPTMQGVRYQEYKPQEPYKTQDTVAELEHEPIRGHDSNAVELSAM
ncbi:hypothetical protein HD806DRAFT_360268 [Xylariaceae sp. AK1471]|nr:hypothetical protein HD806DRAFT_360268 [Xylariaceae sp. AK1471]